MALRKTRPTALTLLAPAKINFYLRIVGRRPDGYHLLESLMAPVSLYDRIRIRSLERPEIRLSTSGTELPEDSQNLAWRAADLLRRHARVRAGVQLRLEKRIPIGAGLGGGSSDAAAVLRGLNRLWRLRLSVSCLARLGERLGADVPFAVHGRPAVVRGVGDEVRPLRHFPCAHLALVWPGFAISTGWAYEKLRFRGDRAQAPSPLSSLVRGKIALRDACANDLEAVAASAYPQLTTLEQQLRELGAETALMTGSGSAVFGLFTSAAASRRAAAALRRQDLWARAVRTLARAPASRPSTAVSRRGLN
jgi:4-diphosphocytidyl-2-C-methyl-D-erythritol kinase